MPHCIPTSTDLISIYQMRHLLDQSQLGATLHDLEVGMTLNQENQEPTDLLDTAIATNGIPGPNRFPP